MATVKFNGEILANHRIPENLIGQGDFIYCEATGGANSFWGIYSVEHGVIDLDGAGSSYIPKVPKLYLGDTYRYWTIAHRITCNEAKVTIGT